MRGLLLKTLRETWVVTALLGVALLLVMMLISFVLPQFQDEFAEIWLRVPFVRTMLSALLGVDLGTEVTSQMIQSIVWVHPLVLAILWAHEMMFCTRFPAGEVDRGTIDVLLGLPLSRRAVYAGESVMWIASGLFILALGAAGHTIGSGESGLPFWTTARVLLNLLALYVAVGGFACLVSAISDRRARAIGVIFGVVLASFLLSFLAQFWAPAQRLAFMSVLEYYQPAFVVRSGQLTASDVLVLFGVGAVCWIAGGEIVARRSLCTV